MIALQDRDADAYALCNFTRGSTSVTELPDGLRPLFRAEAFDPSVIDVTVKPADDFLPGDGDPVFE